MPAVCRRFLALALACFGLMLAPSADAVAQTGANYPNRAIKLVVPFPPGGGADFLGRLLAAKMGEALGQPMIVENKPGAATSIGSDAVAKSAPDGHTLLLLLRDMSLNPSLMTSLPYDTLKSFAWVGKVANGPFVLVANPSLGVKSLDELVKLAKSKPGAVSYGSLGVGGLGHISTELMVRELKIDLLHVPYKGAGPALQATVAGEVGLTVAALTGAVPFVNQGKLVALAVGADKRAPQLPDTPTIGEAGGGNSILMQYYALAAPAGTPKPVIDRLNAVLKQTLDAPDIAERLLQNGLWTAYSTPEAFAAEMASDVAFFAKLINEFGIKPE